jgi:hypothetical protein
MTHLARLLFVLGVASIAYGAARWEITSRLVGKNMAAFEEYRQSLPSSQSGVPRDEALGRLMKRLALVGGPYRGKDDCIAFGAAGLVILSIGFYVQARDRDSKKDKAQPTGCTERRDRASVDNRPPLARRR